MGHYSRLDEHFEMRHFEMRNCSCTATTAKGLNTGQIHATKKKSAKDRASSTARSTRKLYDMRRHPTGEPGKFVNIDFHTILICHFLNSYFEF